MKPNPALIDDENPEWTKEELAQAKWGYEIFSPNQLLAIKEAQSRMKERLAKEKNLKRVSLSLDEKVITHFKATGKGWQQRINDVLLKELAV
jgi:uncharacterized protein (DUF4415 family)